MMDLAPEEWYPLYRCQNSYATGPVLYVRLKFLDFIFQGSSTLNNLMGGVKTIWEPYVPL